MTLDETRLQAALAGRYRLVRELGHGGMSTVLLADDLRHERPVALKVLRADVAASLGAGRFLHEIRVTARLQHPHILPLFDSGEVDGLLFYVMPFVAGESLRRRLDRTGPLEVAEAVRLVTEVAEALDYAHRHGVVHRDVKPENILLADGQAVVADFGVARALSAAASERATGPGFAIGTPAYMSPEAAAGAEDVDGRGDQYGLACVLHELLTGEPPFHAASARATMAQHVTQAPPPLRARRPEVPAAIEQAVARALSKDPAERFPSVTDFVRALGAPAAVPAGPPASVAVLPFADLGAEPGRDYLADGITDEIINALARLDGLRVASRTSSFALKHLPLDVRAVGARLGVQAVLEGSIQHEGRRLRVTARLVDTADGAQLWSERYDREFADVFAIQDEIAASIARALRLVLTERERRSMARVPTADLEAYEAYLRGRQFFHQRRRKSLQYARELFSHAIERDPTFAPAWAGIADCCSLLAVYYPGAETDLLLADSASRRALELAPDLPEAHASRGFALWMLKRPEEAVHEFEAALTLDPRQFDALYFQARLRFQQGEAAEAARLFERAAEGREDYEARFFAAQSYATLGRTEDAEAAYRRALAAAADHMALNPDDPRAATMRAVAHCRVGERQEGLRWAERAMQIDPDDAGVLYNVACLYSLEGERERAIDCLERAVAQGFGNREWIARDPDLDPLRDDPRFTRLAGTQSSRA